MLKDRPTTDRPLTILDPTGQLTAADVESFLGKDNCLRVVGQIRVHGESIIYVDHDLEDVDYYDPTVNEWLVMIAFHFLFLGCQFTRDKEIRLAHSRKIRGK
jgi:hypothetical protein